jgi:dihydroorotase-like cyclic amidohydrolase
MIYEKLSEWNPVVVENYYISPGLIDLEVYVAKETGGFGLASEAAIRGGATLIVEHPNPYYDPAPVDSGFLYCDVARLQSVNV